MQQQICPRCKFRLTGAKPICSTCGYSFNSVRKQPEATSPAVGTPKPAPRTNPSTSASTASASLRQVQSSSNNQGAGSFWRAFFGLDPLPSDKGEREEALGET